MSYKAIHKHNQLIYGTGKSVAIVTGWTDPKQVAKQLDPAQYAVIGSLFNASRGIEFLLLNLLANPQIRVIYLLDATQNDANSGSIQCLRDLWHHGVSKVSNWSKWRINSEIEAYLPPYITSSHLAVLREKVSIFTFASVASLVEWVNDFPINKLPDIPWTELIDAPLPPIEPAPDTKVITYPGEIIGLRVDGDTVADTWLEILHRIWRYGKLRPTGYDGQIKELIDLVAVVKAEPKVFYFPEPNYLPIDRKFLESYMPQMCLDSHYQEGVKYTYGQRINSWFGVNQVDEVIDKLIAEIDSASAVINLWDSGGNLARRPDGSSDHKHSGSPCLNHIWFRVVDNALLMTATFRSNDMFSAWPANAMGLICLQRYVLGQLLERGGFNLDCGELITVSQSAHLYDDTFDSVELTLNKHYQLKKPNYLDPIGNFTIEWSDDKIVVIQFNHTGEEIGHYINTNPLKIIREISHNNPTIKLDHIGYLGLELERASTKKQDYIQDRK